MAKEPLATLPPARIGASRILAALDRNRIRGYRYDSPNAIGVLLEEPVRQQLASVGWAEQHLRPLVKAGVLALADPADLPVYERIARVHNAGSALLLRRACHEVTAR